MKAAHLAGLAIGLTVSALSVVTGDPAFFTSEHAEIWHEHLAARGLLPERFTEPQPFVGGPDIAFSQWGY